MKNLIKIINWQSKGKQTNRNECQFSLKSIQIRWKLDIFHCSNRVTWHPTLCSTPFSASIWSITSSIKLFVRVCIHLCVENKYDSLFSLHSFAFFSRIKKFQQWTVEITCLCAKMIFCAWRNANFSSYLVLVNKVNPISLISIKCQWNGYQLNGFNVTLKWNSFFSRTMTISHVTKIKSHERNLRTDYGYLGLFCFDFDFEIYHRSNGFW